MPAKFKTIMPLIAVGALLAGCGTGQATSDASSSTPSGSPEATAAASSPMASGDCSELQTRWIGGDLPQEFYDGVDQGVRVVETTSGTILQGDAAVYDPDASAPASRGPDRVEPDPEWPKDSVVYIDAESGDVVKMIDVPNDLKCAP